jgi:hypothetical protein
MTFQPENRLEKSLLRAVQEPVYRLQFCRDFLESDVFIIQHGSLPAGSGATVLQEGCKINIQKIDINGKLYTPVFSSIPRLQAILQNDAGYIVLNALEFLKMAQGSDVLLNPGSEYGKEFTRDEIQSILDGSIWNTPESYCVDKKTQIMIGQPANYPYNLTKALTQLFRKNREVKQAYLAHFFNPERDEKPHTLIGIKVSSNWDQVVSQACLVARDIEIPDPPVDFIQITEKGETQKYFLNECKPFYRRRFWNGL